MEVYLVYEFTYCSIDDCITEEIEFFGLFKNKDEAINKSKERINKGIKEDFVMSDDVTNKEDPFKETNSISMYRKDYEKDDSPIYSINIRMFKI